MFIQSDSTYQIGKNALDAYSLRQETISHNIANVNTEHFKAKTVNFETELKQALSQQSSGLKTTNKRHIGTNGQATGVTATIDQPRSETMMNLDGNNVDIDLEMANMAANQIQYNAMVQQIGNTLNNYHYVIKGA